MSKFKVNRSDIGKPKQRLEAAFSKNLYLARYVHLLIACIILQGSYIY